MDDRTQSAREPTPASSTDARDFVFGAPRDPIADEELRVNLIAITEAERKALNDAGHFIAASSDLPGVQGLADVVLTVANRGGVKPDGQ